MRIDGVNLIKGSSFVNATIAGGVTFPIEPSSGELFFRSDEKQLYCYNGNQWNVLISDTNNVAPDWLATSGPSAILNRPNLYFYTFLSVNRPTPQYFQVARLPESTLGTYDQVRLVGSFNDGWAAVNNNAIDAIFGNRAAEADPLASTNWACIGSPAGLVRLQAFRQTDGSVNLWLYLAPGAYAAASFSLQGWGNQLTIFPPQSTPYLETLPPGTITFDSGDPSIVPPVSYALNGGLEIPSGITIGQTATNTVSFNILARGNYSSTINGITTDEQLRLRVNGAAGSIFPGAFSWSTRGGVDASAYATGYELSLRALDTHPGASWSDQLLTVKGNGNVGILGSVTAGSGIPQNYGANSPSTHRFYADVDELIQVGRSGHSAPIFGINCYADMVGGGWSASPAALYAGHSPFTGRAANFSGSVNVNGNDYAEYMYKAKDCGMIEAGQVVGINKNGELVDKWDDAIKFVVKSTMPSFVGGDTWAIDLPKPVRDKETEEEWVTIMAEYSANFEERRNRVDRIAFCGQVPVNTTEAKPGQHIVPVQQGLGIYFVCVDDADITFAQYRKSVGQVIAKEPDGRARIIVKI